MRRVIYKALVSLPAKATSGGATLLGLFGTFAPESARKVLGDRMTADNIHSLGILLLVAAMAYFFLLWQLKPGEEESSGTSNSTAGDNSHVLIHTGVGPNFVAQTVNFEPPKLEMDAPTLQRIESALDINRPVMIVHAGYGRTVALKETLEGFLKQKGFTLTGGISFARNHDLLPHNAIEIWSDGRRVGNLNMFGGNQVICINGDIPLNG